VGAGAAACGRPKPCVLAVGLGVPASGLADPLGVAPGDAVPPAVPLGDGVPAGAGAAAVEEISGRKLSCAVCPTCLAASLFWPGTEMMIRSRPWVTTSASATPSALTRRSMICLACFIASGLGCCPLSVRACSVTVVPPCRSSPSFGVAESPVKKTSR
jgi:hypothetical protein